MLQIYLNKKIIDRETETGTLVNDIQKADKLTINILYAPTAVGKSSVTKKLADRLNNNRIDVISVKTPPINNNATLSFSYLEYLFNSFCAHFVANALSFENFISEQYKNGYIDLAEILQTSENKATFIMKSIAKMIENRNFDVEKLKFNSVDKLYLQQKYINFVLSKNRLVIIWDNLQNIDDNSLDFLKRTLNFNYEKNHYIVFEYTEKNDFEKIFQIGEYFKNNNIDVKCTEIRKIDSSFIVDIIDQNLVKKPKCENFNVDLIKFYQEQNNGNIREVFDYSRNYESYIKNGASTNATYAIIKNLSDASMFILFILFRFGGSISLDNLKRIFSAGSIERKIGGGINELSDYDFIDVNGEVIQIAHASIFDALIFFESQNHINKLATSCIRRSIEKGLENKNIDILKDKQLNVLLEIYKETDPLSISNLFSDIENNFIINLNVDKAWQYLNSFLQVITPQIEKWQPLCIDILKLCFKFELYREGYEYCLQIINHYIDFNNKPIFIVSRMMFLSALDEHDLNIEFFESANIAHYDPQTKLNIYLIMLSAYRSVGNLNKCLEIEKLLKDKQFNKFAEYGYRFRLVDMYMPREKAVKYLKKSVDFFKRYNLNLQMAKSLISYSTALAGLGKVNKAIMQLEKAKNLLNGQIIGRHMLQVNSAVFKMLGGNYNATVYQMLDAAETSAIVPFDKLAIIVNKLVWIYENKRFDLVADLECRASELIDKEPDKHIHCLLFYNLYLLYKTLNQNETAILYYNRAKSLIDYCNPVKARLTGTPTRENSFILTKPWHICYLVYWTYDILMDYSSS